MSAWQIGLLVALIMVSGLSYLLWARSRAARRETGLPEGEVVYADTEGWEACRPLYASRWGLAGKPDYIVRSGGNMIPVEVKPCRRAEHPYEGDVLQLAAYCLLVEETTGQRPPYGLLRYAERSFRIPYDHRLYEALLVNTARRDGDIESIVLGLEDTGLSSLAVQLFERGEALGACRDASDTGEGPLGRMFDESLGALRGLVEESELAARSQAAKEDKTVNSESLRAFKEARVQRQEGFLPPAAKRRPAPGT